MKMSELDKENKNFVKNEKEHSRNDKNALESELIKNTQDKNSAIIKENSENKTKKKSINKKFIGQNEKSEKNVKKNNDFMEGVSLISRMMKKILFFPLSFLSSTVNVMIKIGKAIYSFDSKLNKKITENQKKYSSNISKNSPASAQAQKNNKQQTKILKKTNRVRNIDDLDKKLDKLQRFSKKIFDNKRSLNNKKTYPMKQFQHSTVKNQQKSRGNSI